MNREFRVDFLDILRSSKYGLYGFFGACLLGATGKDDRTNYEPLELAVDALSSSKNLYDYYVASGFAGFWPPLLKELYEHFERIEEILANATKKISKALSTKPT
jgi:hypothetical protein